VINVALVSLPSPGETVAAEGPTTAPAAKTVRPSSPAATGDRVAVDPGEKKEKQSLKKRTFKASKVVKSAISNLEKKAEESRPDPLKAALERLQKEVEATGSPPGKKGAQKLPGQTGPGMENGSEAGIQRALELIDIYRVEIAYRVQKNWAFSESLAGGRADLVVELAFNVLPDGEIRDIWFDKRSGNAYLDESAKKAVMKSNPVAPHPPGINQPYVTVGLRFTPEGVR
jgi:colicin import membrane protein